MFTARLPTAAEAVNYATYYHAGSLQVPAFVQRQLDQVVSSLEAYRKLNRWLDVGCGTGALMRSAKALGWAVVGTEVTSAAVEAARGTGLDVRLGELDALDLPDEAFDVVSLVEVIEHVSDPDELLQQAASRLRPHGALYMTTPHVRGISGRISRTEWSIVAPPEHLQLFSVQGLEKLMDRCGLAPRRVHTHGVDPHNLLAALRPGHQERTVSDRVEASCRVNESLSSSRVGSLTRRVVNSGLSATHLGDGLKVVAVKGHQSRGLGRLRV
jgi:SAM-dependent methyltransferase